MTPRQTLTALAAPHRYRVRLDAEGWPMIPGRYGRLERATGSDRRDLPTTCPDASDFVRLDRSPSPGSVWVKCAD
jgi:hypothetical protein